MVFTPRQVLLSNQTMKHTAQNGTPNSKREPLHQSIARYLELRGFSKTLKKFRSEAQIEVNYIAEFDFHYVEPYFYAWTTFS